MTQAEFDGLPGLLTRSQFLSATGLGKDALRELVLARKIDVYGPRTTRGPRLKAKRKPKCKYYKREAARFGGFRL